MIDRLIFKKRGPILFKALLCDIFLTYALDLCIPLLKLCLNFYFLFNIIKQALVFCLCFPMLLEAKLSMLITVIIINGKSKYIYFVD